MKLYLAGPMTGYKDFNFPAFHKAANDLRNMGHEVFNPAEKDIENYGSEEIFKGDGDTDVLKAKGGPSLRECLAIDLDWICKHAEGIALMQGWEKSRGATAENATACAIGCVRIFQDLEGNWVQIGGVTGHGPK
jgi:Domain of unknown function (DUF4406)